ncbi:MAG: hypothetical protein QGG84_12655, partial [Rhodospirillales bacterium]|nr:hypothetical protein [Rhodospirillales bacterium]
VEELKRKKDAVIKKQKQKIHEQLQQLIHSEKINIIDALPKTPANKIDKQQLRQIALKHD